MLMNKRVRIYIGFSIITIFLISFSIISGCGGSGGGGTTNPSDSTPSPTPTGTSNSFAGYVYAPARSSREATQTGLVVLTTSITPSGYQPVPGAKVYPETNPDNIMTTDNSGKFTYDFGISNQRESNPVKNIIEPHGNFAGYAPVYVIACPLADNPSQVTKLILHPNAKNIKTGEVIQLYAKALTTDGQEKYIDPTRVVWQVDNEAVGTISSTGVFTGVGEGTAYITITSGSLNCTGKVFVRSAQTTYTLSGTVTDSSGNPVSNADVTIAGFSTVGVSGTGGNYSIPGLPANTNLDILVYYLGVPRYNATLSISGNTTYNITLQNQAIQTGGITGIVTNTEGAPIEGVLVSYGDWGTTTDSSGQYTLAGIPTGEYLFRFDKLNYVSKSLYQAITANQNTTLNVTMAPTQTIPTNGTLNGRVVDQAGNGISAATVSYSSRSVVRPHKSVSRLGGGATTTDSNGFFVFLNVPSGNYRADASKDGYMADYADIIVIAGQETNCVIILSVAPSPTPSPSPSPLKQRCIGGSGSDALSSVRQTTDGGYIVAGFTTSNDGDISGNHGGGDMLVAKLDYSGNITWQKCLGGSNYDEAKSVEQTTDGGYIVNGYSYSSDGDISGHHGACDYLVTKLYPNGNVQWQKCFGGTSMDAGYCVQQTTDGGYILEGVSNSTNGDVTGNHSGSNDFWIVKLDPSGDITWQKCLGGSLSDGSYSVQQTTDGGYILGGLTCSNDGNVSGNHGSVDYWVVKLTSSGVLSWQKCLGGSDEDWLWSIRQTSDGGYGLAGWSLSTDGDVTGSHGGGDIWVVNLDSEGNICWQKSLGGSGADEIRWEWPSIWQTVDGGYFVAGCSDSTDGDVTGNKGDADFWVVKLNTGGNISWQKCFGGSLTDRARSGVQTTDGGYVVVGWTHSSDGDVSGNHSVTYPQDGWIIKLDSNGNL